MLKKLIFYSVCVVLLLPSFSDGSRILISAPYGTKSYHNMFVPLVQELSLRGHHVTVISNYKSSDLEKTENVRQIVLEKLEIDLSPYPNTFEALLSVKLMLKSVYIGLTSMFNYPKIIAEVMYNDERILDLIAIDQFDLVMVSISFNPASYPLAWHFKAPIIMLTPNAIFPGILTSLGDEEQPSYIPFFLSSFSGKMNLLQRTINTIATQLFATLNHEWQKPTIHAIAQQRVPGCPPLTELEKNISLVFTNTHPAMNYPRPMAPSIVEVGGIHCRPARPLPKDLEGFVSHPDGFILFAVGSMLPMEVMPSGLMEAFIQTFERLPQRVIWQWKGKVRANLPANVLALPWLPQQDLLGHKNCKLFMTHGGLNSIQEAIYHSVPLLGLPFGTDQKLNMLRAVNDGYARKLLWTEISQKVLEEAILDLIDNSSYLEAMRERSKLYHDQLQSPLERAVFWTEFVIRHNGTQHLQLSSRNLEPYQRALLDVYLILTLAAILPLLTVVWCLRKCCRRKGRPNANSNKKNN